MTKYQKKNLLIGGLLAIVVLMAVAYAAFASNLTITGTGNTTNNWDIRITNIRGVNECLSGATMSTKPNDENKVEYIPNAEGSGKVKQMGTILSCGKNDASDITAPTKSADGLSATFNTGLVQPGDTRIYEVEVTNSGSLDAVVSHTLTNNSNNPAIEITYDGYSTTPVLTEGGEYSSTSLQTLEPFDLLKNNGKKYIYITVKYSDSVTSQPNNLTAQATITLNVTQKESSSSVGPNTGGSSESGTTFTGTIYRWNTTAASNGDSIVPVSGTKYVITNGVVDLPLGPYETEEECNTVKTETGAPDDWSCQEKTGTFGGVGEYTTNASTLNKTYYLKHDVEDDIITASYVCFVYNSVEHCLKGGDNGASFAANTQIIQDYQTFYSLPNNAEPGCNFGSSLSDCTGGGFSDVYADSMGSVGVSGSSSEYCGVRSDGHSDCGG
ncbi:MAG: hypothetical protein IKG40_04255 [Bacilli bacterium]|nr:hypothetical protein [Bacilli bacterium]